MYRVLDIKITEKKNMYGLIYNVDSLRPRELSMYIGELIEFDNKKYMVETIYHDCIEKRELKVFRGKKQLIY